MATIYPAPEHRTFDSRSEQLFLSLLGKSLGDDFIVIYDIPWLVDLCDLGHGFQPPTGQLDFLILHKKYGALILELKGGNVEYDGMHYFVVYKNSSKRRDPLKQVRNSEAGLARWLEQEHEIKQRFGYGLVFPYIDTMHLPLAPGYTCGPFDIRIGCQHFDALADRIKELMLAWQAVSIGRLPQNNFDGIVNALLASATNDGWAQIIRREDREWLRFTPEQMEVVAKIATQPRSLTTGWAGTGKTVLAIHVARLLSNNGRVLFITYNSLVAAHIQSQIDQHNVDCYTFYKLSEECINRFGYRGQMISFSDRDMVVAQGFDNDLLGSYSHVIIDEVQAFASEVIASLLRNKSNGVHLFCDPFQRFNFEDERGELFDPDSVQLSAEKLSRNYLSRCVRCPQSVGAELRKINASNVEIVFPRVDEGRMQRMVSADPARSAAAFALQLMNAEGVSAEDIAILHSSLARVKFPELPNELIVTSIPRFRGMERAVVIILVNAGLDDVEYYVAMSRATARCLIIMDAYALRAQKSAYEGSVYGNALKTEYSEMAAEKIKEHRPFHDVLHITPELTINFGTTIVEFIRPLNVISVRSSIDDYLVDPVIEYLCLNGMSVIKHSCITKSFLLYPPLLGYETDLFTWGGRNIEFMHCAKCSAVTPQAISGHPQIGECVICNKPNFDDAKWTEITMDLRADREVSSLPAGIRACKAVEYFFTTYPEFQRDIIVGGSTAAYRLAYRLALGHIAHTRVSFDRSKKKEGLWQFFNIADIGLSFKDWCRYLSQAFSTLQTKEYLKVEEKNQREYFIGNKLQQTPKS